MPFMGGGGGGSTPIIARDRFTEQVVLSIASGDSQRMPWGGSAGPDHLFDLTDPTTPAVIASGVYAVAVNADAVDALTEGYPFALALDVDLEGDTAEQAVRSALASAIVSRPRAFIAMTYYIPAGHSLCVPLANIDSVSRQYKIEDITVQRLS